MGNIAGVLVPLVAVTGGVVIALARIVTNSRRNRKADPRMEDKIHLLEMRMSDMEEELQRSRNKEISNK